LKSRPARQTVTSGGSDTVTDYVYNDAGIKVQKIKNPGEATEKTTYYLIDQANPTGYAQVLIEETWDTSTATPAFISRRSYTIGDDVITQSDDPGTASAVEYLLYDGQGSTRQVTDATIDSSNDIIDSYSYDAYGMMLGGNPTSSPSTNLLYTGEQFDTDLQQYYLRARYYNPSNGRFNRMDPFAGNDQDPQSLHKYTYCHANPVNNIDPTGQFTLAGMTIANSIRSIMANLQFDVGGYAMYAAESASAGVSVNQALLYAAAFAVGGFLLGKVSQVAGRLLGKLPQLFRKPAHFLPKGIRYSGKVFRGVSARYIDNVWDITAHNIGQSHRYSGMGRGSLYTGVTRQTAIKEITAYRRDIGDYIIKSKHIDIDNILDLTDRRTLKWLGVAEEELIQKTGDDAADYFIPNAIGDFARSRYNGLLVPSAVDAGGNNLVLFRSLQ